VSGLKEETALGAARSRFLEGLPKKAAEIRASVAVGAGAPENGPARDELRRRVHALHASALVFRVDDLAKLLDEAIVILDGYRRDGRPIDDEAIDRLMSVVGAVISAAPPLSHPSDENRSTLPGVGGSDASRLSPHEHPTRPGTVSTVSFGLMSPQPRASLIAPRPSKAPSIDTVLSVMLVGPLATRLAAALPADRFEVSLAEARDALVAARHGAPDVIIAGDDVVSHVGTELVRALRGDPMTDLVPLLLVTTNHELGRATARERGLDDVLTTSADARALAEKVARLAGLLPSTRGAELGSITLRDAAERMAEEIRRGLVDAADRGADDVISLGDGTELFAATWSAIARMRTAIVDRSQGRVHFRDVERRGGPAWLAMGSAPTTAQSAVDVSLTGRRILVADDDPAVRWFFVGLLEDAGAEVLEAPDGETALDFSRRYALDLVITDILMPKLDGLSLSRELARDPTTADVPVIFLSWKEDFLQRMRELRAGAVGYLRKEEGAAVILDRVRDAFRPRLRFEARLRDGGDVRGRVEGLGLSSILRSVSRIRKDARITVRDVSNLFEIDVRRGQIVELVRTASDGTFARGRRALASLLGVSAGRFAVLPPVIGQRPGVEPIGPEIIEREATRLGALIDSVSGRGLALADRIDLDESVVATILPISPPEIIDVVHRLERNPSPRRWLLSGEVAPEVLGAALVELARRGAVLSVRGEAGEDRVVEALARRRGVTAEEITGSPSHPKLPAVGARDTHDYADANAPLEEAEGVIEDSSAPVESVAAAQDSQDSQDSRDRETSDDEPELSVGDAERIDSGVIELPAEDEGLIVSSNAAASALAAAAVPTAPRRASPDDTVKVHRGAARSIEAAQGSATGERALAGWIVPLGLAVVLALIVGIAMLAMRDTPGSHRRGDPGVPLATATERSSATPTPRVDLVPPIEDPLLYGVIVPLGGLGTQVPGLTAGKGALVVEAPAPASVRVDGQDVGQAPVTRAVDPGFHQLEVRLGDEVMFRRIPVRAGQARRLLIH